MRVARFDRIGPIHSNPERRDGVLASKTADGFMRLEGRFTRWGFLEYSDGKDTWIEFRPREELECAFPSFHLLPITNDHPPDMLNAENVRDYQVGHQGNDVRWDEAEPDFARVSMLVTDAAAIADIEGGKLELSLGFTAEVHDTPGIQDGVAYRYVQRGLVGNHTALVDEGRAGPKGRLLTDAAGAAVHRGDHMKTRKPEIRTDDGETEKIVLGGEEVELPSMVIDLFKRQQVVIEEMQRKINELSAPSEPAAAAPPAEPTAPVQQTLPMPDQQTTPIPTPPENTPVTTPVPTTNDSASALQARIDALEAERKQDRENEAARIDARVRLVTDARAVLGQNAKTDGVSDAELMRQVVVKVLPGLQDKLDAYKGDAGYLRASFDRAVEKYREENAPSRELGDAIASPANDEGSDEVASIISSIIDMQDHNDARAAGIRLAEGSN